MLPPRVRSAIDSTTVNLLALDRYVAAGVQRDVAIGTFASFLEQLTEEGQYRKINIIAYSAGSIITLDALFPFGPPIRRFSEVNTLVTIGCPADLVKMYWPKYFQGRTQLDGTPTRWVNIFYPSDPLASNFIDGDTNLEEPNPRESWITRSVVGTVTRRVAGTRKWSGILVRTENQGSPKHPDKNVRQALVAGSAGVGFTLATIRAHRSYWHPSNIHAASAFDTIVQDLYPNGSR